VLAIIYPESHLAAMREGIKNLEPVSNNRYRVWKILASVETEQCVSNNILGIVPSQGGAIRDTLEIADSEVSATTGQN
jgi:hypothetical protein